MPAGTTYIYKEGMLSPWIRKRTEADGEYYELEIKNHFLHAAHPLGWIKKIEILVDGKTIREQDIYFVVRNQWFPVTKIHTITEVFWHLIEPAQICFRGFAIGQGTHQIECRMTTSLSDDTQIVDRKGIWPDRVEKLVWEVNWEDAK